MPRTHRSLRPIFLLATGLLLGSAVFVMACTDDESPPTGATPDAATIDLDSSNNNKADTQPSSNDSSVPIVDAASDAEEIFDGGGTPPPEDDGGLTDLDGGFDAGPSCQLITSGAFSSTTCAGLSAVHVGGTLTTTTYQLAKVTVLGSKTFCGVGGGYVVYEHRGGLRVTATSATTATFEFLDQYRKPSAVITRPTSVRYDVDVAASSATLTYTPKACALKPAPSSAQYTATTNAAGKKVLTLRLPYGTVVANYQFVEP